MSFLVHEGGTKLLREASGGKHKIFREQHVFDQPGLVEVAKRFFLEHGAIQRNSFEPHRCHVGGTLSIVAGGVDEESSFRLVLKIGLEETFLH